MRRAEASPLVNMPRAASFLAARASALPIVAHSGEWILNRSQQGRLASWMGTTSGQIKRLLGFTGKASGGFYQDGGEVGRIPSSSAGSGSFAKASIACRRGMSLALMDFGELVKVR